MQNDDFGSVRLSDLLSQFTDSYLAAHNHTSESHLRQEAAERCKNLDCVILSRIGKSQSACQAYSELVSNSKLLSLYPEKSQEYQRCLSMIEANRDSIRACLNCSANFYPLVQ